MLGSFVGEKQKESVPTCVSVRLSRSLLTSEPDVFCLFRSLSASKPDVVRLAFWPSTGGLPVQPSGSADGATYFCSLCQLSCSGAAPYRQHLDSAKHLKKALELKGVATDGAAGTAAAG